MLYSIDGNFDIPDRSFHSLETTWRLAAKESNTDFKLVKLFQISRAFSYYFILFITVTEKPSPNFITFPKFSKTLNTLISE